MSIYDLSILIVLNLSCKNHPRHLKSSNKLYAFLYYADRYHEFCLLQLIQSFLNLRKKERKICKAMISCGSRELVKSLIYA